MRKALRVIDSIGDWTGKIARWCCVALVAVITYDVTWRYVLGSPRVWAHEVSLMLGGTIFAMGWCYAHRLKSHVRVDVLYVRLPVRGRAIIDVLLAALFFFPFMIWLIKSAGFWAWRAWSIGERMAETYWWPPAAPIRTVLVIGFFLFLLQGIAHFVRDLHLLVRGKPYD